MSVSFTCSCGKRFRSRPELAGRLIECSACGKTMRIPGGQTQNESIASPATSLAWRLLTPSLALLLLAIAGITTYLIVNRAPLNQQSPEWPIGQLSVGPSADPLIRATTPERSELQVVSPPAAGDLPHIDLVASAPLTPSGVRGSWVRFKPSDRTGAAQQSLTKTTGRQAISELRRFEGHTDSVVYVEFSPDGRFILSASADKTLRLWEVATGLQVRSYHAIKDTGLPVRFAPDGRSLFAVRDQGGKKPGDPYKAFVVRFDLNTGFELQRFDEHPHGIKDLSISVDGRKLIGVSHVEAIVQVWDLTSGKQLNRLSMPQLPTETLVNIAISADGNRVLRATMGLIELWDIAGRKMVRQFFSGRVPIKRLQFSADGRHFLVSFTGGIQLWDIATGNTIQSFDAPNGIGAFTMGLLSAQGGLILAAPADYNDKRIVVVDVKTQKMLRTLDGHNTGSSVFTFSPDQKFAASAGFDRIVRLWDLESGKELKRFGATTGWQIDGESCSLTGQIAVGAGVFDDSAWLLQGIDPPRVVRRLAGHTDRVVCVAVSPDGKRIATGSRDATVRLWDAVSGAEQCCLRSHAGAVWNVAFSPDNTMVVSAGDDRTACLWEVATGRKLHTFLGHQSAVQGAVFTDDGAQILSGDAIPTVCLWSAADGREIRRFEGSTEWLLNSQTHSQNYALAAGQFDHDLWLWEEKTKQTRRFDRAHEDRVLGVALFDKKHLPPVRAMSGSRDCTVRLWDVGAGKELRRFLGHSDAVWCVAFSEDGKQAVSTSSDKTVRIWDVDTGKQIALCEGHTDAVWCAAFSFDGKRVVSGSRDRTARVWDAATGKQQCCLTGHSDSIWCVAFPGANLERRIPNQVLTGSQDRTARLWDLKTDKEMHRFDGMPDAVTGVAFQDDQRIATVCADRTGFRWNTSTRPISATRFDSYVPTMADVRMTSDGQLQMAVRWEEVQKATIIGGGGGWIITIQRR